MRDQKALGGDPAAISPQKVRHLPTPPHVSSDDTVALELTLAMLAERLPDGTVCPSEVARALSARAGLNDWRDAMPRAHAAVDRLIAAGQVRLTWKGRVLNARRGPYRIGGVEHADET